MSDESSHGSMPSGGFADFFNAGVSAEVSPRQGELRRLGDAVRAVIDALTGTEAPVDVVTAAADELEAVAAALAPYPHRWTMEGYAESSTAGDTHAFFDSSPIMGHANPLAAPMRMSVEDGVVVGRVTFGRAYEGPPACVHGGYLAAAFDELLGMAQSLSGSPGMTGTLTVRYRRPTPLRTELRFEGAMVRVEGRKIFTEGRCYAGDELTCEAEGIFISVGFEKFARLLETRD